MIIKYVLKQGNISPCGRYYNKCAMNYYSLWSVDHKGEYNSIKINLDSTFIKKEVYRNKKIGMV